MYIFTQTLLLTLRVIFNQKAHYKYKYTIKLTLSKFHSFKIFLIQL